MAVNSSAIFSFSELREMSINLGPDIFQSLLFTYEEHSRTQQQENFISRSIWLYAVLCATAY